MKYFETYGYYPLVDPTPQNCCGEEPDCKQRQAARKYRLGFDHLKTSLQWLAGAQKKKGILIIRSPAIHHGRSYVSEESHAAIIRNMLQMIAGSQQSIERTYWMSATPMKDHSSMVIQEKVMLDNRSKKRWHFHKIEQRQLLAHPSVHFWDVWHMAQGRRDRFYDSTHVYPYPSYKLKATDFPRTVASTFSSMLKTMLLSHWNNTPT